MKGVIFTCLFLSTTFVFSQNTFTVKELVDIYLTDKENAIKAVEAKRYSPAGQDEVRKMFSNSPGDNHIYIQSNKNSRVGLVFDKSKVQHVLLHDSVDALNPLLSELRAYGFDLVNEKEGMFEVYTSKKVNYFIGYERMDLSKKTTAIISVLPKHKNYEMLYKPKKKKS